MREKESERESERERERERERAKERERERERDRGCVREKGVCGRRLFLECATRLCSCACKRVCL